ncbi:MAG: glycoside hydrolase family 2 protein [Promethearchaeota archaeon]
MFRETNRVEIPLDGSWDMIYDPEDSFTVDSFKNLQTKNSVSVPSVFNVTKEGAGYVGVVWYRKRLVVLCNDNGLFELRLEGWYGSAEFYVNFLKIGARDYGFTPHSMFFRFGKGGQKKAELMILIKIDNRPKPGQTFKTPIFKQWGGLHRSVTLSFLPSTFIKDVLFQSDVDLTTLSGQHAIALVSCMVHVCALDSIELQGMGPVKVTMNLIEDGSNNNIIDFDAQEEIPAGFLNKKTLHCFNLATRELKTMRSMVIRASVRSKFRLWDIKAPNLYRLIVRAANDEVIYNVGVRDISVDSNGYLLLNGSPVLFLGVNRHDEHPDFGPAFIRQDIEQVISMMKDAGFTGIRPAHYPTTDYLLELCDRYGIMVMEEVPNYIMSREMMQDPLVLRQGRDMLFGMVLAHYNHPSIMIWSVANECKSHLPESKGMINELMKLARMMDPKRLVHFTGFPGIQNIAGIRADVVGINVYYGDSVSKNRLNPEVLGPVLDNLREFMLDPEFDMENVTVFITEFGSQTVYGYHDIHPYRGEGDKSSPYTPFTEERQAWLIEQFFKVVKDRPFVSGLLVWCWRDNRYEPEIAQSSAGAIMRYGLLDWTGAPKLGFHTLVKMIEKLKNWRKTQKE